MQEILEVTDPRVKAEMVDIDSIIVGERFRVEYRDIEQLADSIKKFGLIHFPVIDENNQLVAGGRRLQAVKLLGWKHVQIVRKKCISELRLREMELEENLQRANMTWQEEVAAKENIVRIKFEIYGEKSAGRGQEGKGISQNEIARQLGESPSNLGMDRALAQAMEVVPEIRECKTKDDARKKLRQLQEKLIVEELERRRQETGVKKGSRLEQAEQSFNVCDAVGWLRNQSVQTVDLFYVDTPYGIDLNAIKKTSNDTNMREDNYLEWNSNDYLRLCEAVSAECFRISENSFCIWWFAIQWYQPLMEMHQKIGWKIDPIPGIWYSGGAMSQTNQPEIYLARCYEPFLIMRKGQPILSKRGRENVFNFSKLDPAKKIHPTEKPMPLIMEIFQTFTQKNAHIISPFLGSGNDILSALQMERTCAGCDLNEEVKKRYMARAMEIFK